MEFKKISINQTSYGGVSKGNTNYIEDISAMPDVSNVDFRDGRLIDALMNSDHPEQEHIERVMLLLSLCHTIIIEHKDNKMVYNASSPDELALVNFARFIGFEYQGVDSENIISIRRDNTVRKYELYYNLEFDNTRKRNSVIVKDEQTGEITMFIKGADSVLLNRCGKNRNSTEVISFLKSVVSSCDEQPSD